MSTHPIAPDPWIEYLMSVDTPTLANAIELLKFARTTRASRHCRCAACFRSWAACAVTP